MVDNSLGDDIYSSIDSLRWDTFPYCDDYTSIGLHRGKKKFKMVSVIRVPYEIFRSRYNQTTILGMDGQTSANFRWVDFGGTLHILYVDSCLETNQKNIQRRFKSI